MLALLQQNPIVVDVIKQPPPTPDISIETALSWFAVAGIFLVAATLGSLLVAGGNDFLQALARRRCRRRWLAAYPHPLAHLNRPAFSGAPPRGRP
jgi:hypothetical protein